MNLKKYIFHLKNIYSIFKNIYLCSKIKIYLCSKIYFYVQKYIFMFNKMYIYAQKYTFNLKNIYLFSKNIYIYIQKYWFIYVQKIYIYVPKSIPEQFTAIGQPSFIRGGGVGEPKKVALFQRHRLEEFSSGDSAGDFGLRSFRRPEIYCEGPPSFILKRRGWERRGGSRGGAKKY